MTDMLDRIAKAMHTYGFDRVGSAWGIWQRGADKNPIKVGITTMQEVRDECDRLNARAVLEAMREPTEEMVFSGMDSEPMLNFDAGNVWMRMIDAAMK